MVYLNKVLYTIKGGFEATQLTIKEGTTCIAERALANKNSINEIFLPNSLKCLGKFCLIGCKSLDTIHSHILKPEEVIIEDSFDFSFLNRLSLFVPSGTRWSYRHHPVFGRLPKIEIEKM